MPPPSKIKLSSVPTYLAATRGLLMTRQTVYNWAAKGKQGHILKTQRVAGVLLTTKEWIRDFLSNIH